VGFNFFLGYVIGLSQGLEIENCKYSWGAEWTNGIQKGRRHQ